MAMANSVILSNPFLWIGYLLILALTLFESWKKVTGYWLPLVALALFMVLSAYALLSGASLVEVSTVSLLFFLLNLGERWWSKSL